MKKLAKNTIKNLCISNAIDKLKELQPDEVYGCDLHSKLFDEDYFVIGYYNAEQILNKSEFGIFEAIEKVIEYEKSNFGETTTKINSEAICNMLAYIVGEEILGETSLSDFWDNHLNKRQIAVLIKELKALK